MQPVYVRLSSVVSPLRCVVRKLSQADFIGQILRRTLVNYTTTIANGWGSRSPRVGRLRRAPVHPLQPAARQSQDFVLDRDGFAVWAKRLEKRVFVIPSADPESPRIEITTEEMGALLSGIDLQQAARRQRYRRNSV